MLKFITHCEDECIQFFDDYLTDDKHALFIGTLGFNDLCLYFPELLKQKSNVDFLFLIEDRAEVSPILVSTAQRNREALEAALAGHVLEFTPVQIVADDTAIVAGRSAAKVGRDLLTRGYTDVLVDASAMSRGVCFPIVKQAVEYSARAGGPETHLLVASRSQPSIRTTSMSSDTPQYMHGFQSDMEVEGSGDAIKLWIPQLAEGATASLERIHRKLRPDEACPILPFPSMEPRRGDLLLREFKQPILNEWEVNLLDIIYAHESDPNDVCETITRIHGARHEALSRATGQEMPDRTVLSPAGTRVGSVGMLLAALRLDLPIMYEESIGYTSELTAVPALMDSRPNCRWHVWLRPQDTPR